MIVFEHIRNPNFIGGCIFLMFLLAFPFLIRCYGFQDSTRSKTE